MKQMSVQWLGGPRDGENLTIPTGIRMLSAKEEYPDKSYVFEIPIEDGKIVFGKRRLITT